MLYAINSEFLSNHIETIAPHRVEFIWILSKPNHCIGNFHRVLSGMHLTALIHCCQLCLGVTIAY